MSDSDSDSSHGDGPDEPSPPGTQGKGVLVAFRQRFELPEGIRRSLHDEETVQKVQKLMGALLKIVVATVVANALRRCEWWQGASGGDLRAGTNAEDEKECWLLKKRTETKLAYTCDDADELQQLVKAACPGAESFLTCSRISITLQKPNSHAKNPRDSKVGIALDATAFGDPTLRLHLRTTDLSEPQFQQAVAAENKGAPPEPPGPLRLRLHKALAVLHTIIWGRKADMQAGFKTRGVVAAVIGFYSQNPAPDLLPFLKYLGKQDYSNDLDVGDWCDPTRIWDMDGAHINGETEAAIAKLGPKICVHGSKCFNIRHICLLESRINRQDNSRSRGKKEGNFKSKTGTKKSAANGKEGAKRRFPNSSPEPLAGAGEKGPEPAEARRSARLKGNEPV